MKNLKFDFLYIFSLYANTQILIFSPNCLDKEYCYYMQEPITHHGDIIPRFTQANKAHASTAKMHIRCTLNMHKM